MPSRTASHCPLWSHAGEPGSTWRAVTGAGRRGPWCPSDPLPAGRRRRVPRYRCCPWMRCMSWPSSWTRGTWSKPCCCSGSSSSSAGGSLLPALGRVGCWERGGGRRWGCCTPGTSLPIPSQEPGECRGGLGPGATAPGAGLADPVDGRGEVGSSLGRGWGVVGGIQGPANPLCPLPMPPAERNPSITGGPWAAAGECGPACPASL